MNNFVQNDKQTYSTIFFLMECISIEKRMMEREIPREVIKKVTLFNHDFLLFDPNLVFFACHWNNHIRLIFPELFIPLSRSSFIINKALFKNPLRSLIRKVFITTRAIKFFGTTLYVHSI
jgi:hypothetical protein